MTVRTPQSISTKSTRWTRCFKTIGILKETYFYGKRDLLAYEKRPNMTVRVPQSIRTKSTRWTRCFKTIGILKETYFYGKRDLLAYEKRPNMTVRTPQSIRTKSTRWTRCFKTHASRMKRRWQYFEPAFFAVFVDLCCRIPRPLLLYT
jgi:hypothetical protein